MVVDLVGGFGCAMDEREEKVNCKIFSGIPVYDVFLPHGSKSQVTDMDLSVSLFISSSFSARQNPWGKTGGQ